MVKQIEYHIFLRADATIQTPQVATLGFVTFGALRHDKLRFYTFLYCVILKTSSAMLLVETLRMSVMIMYDY